MVNQNLRLFDFPEAFYPTDIYHTFVKERLPGFHVHASGSGFCSGTKTISHLFSMYTCSTDQNGVRFHRENEIVCGKPSILVADKIIPANCDWSSYAMASSKAADGVSINKFVRFPFGHGENHRSEYSWIFEKARDGYLIHAAAPKKNDVKYLNIAKDGIFLGKPQVLNVDKTDGLISISRVIGEETFYVRFTNVGGFKGSLELNYIESGECTYIVSQNQYCLKPRDVLVINASVPHQSVSNSKTPCSVWSMSIELRPVQAGQIAVNELMEANPCLLDFFDNFENALLNVNSNKIFQMMKEINRKRENNASPSYLNLLANRILMEISSGHASGNLSSDNYIARAADYMMNHYYSIESVSDIADTIGLNKIYLERIFKNITGTSVWQYLSDLRMEKAAILLKSTTVPVGDIDEMVGVHSRQNFYRLFTRRYGISPAAYRKLYRNLD